MIELRLSDGEFEYDIRSLLKAFFPEKEMMTNINGTITGGKNLSEDILNRKNIFLVQTDRHKLVVEFTLNNQKYSKDIKITLDNSLSELEYKSEYRNILKKEMYNMLSEITQKKLPWGTLTGIRPTKIALNLLNEGYDSSYIKQYMKNVYLCSDEKADMSIRVAQKEYKILKDIDYTNGYSVYIGIPFCPTTCLYCSFTSYSAEKYSDYIEKYLDALFCEIEYASTMITKKKLTTIYIGGGTPTTLNENQLERLIDKVKESFDFSYVKEFTVEAGRPDSITYKKLDILKKKGVTRISINPQTMNQSTLDVIGRKHTVEDIINAYNMARDIGHDNINMDIIVGLPGEDIDDVKNTLCEINKLKPDNITIHTLAIKRAAYLNIYKEKYQDMMPEHVEDMVNYSEKFVCDNKYKPYYLYRQKNVTDNLENIGYSIEGKEGIYNILIMEEVQTILALGAGAVCKFVDYKNNRIERVDNVKSVKDYIDRIGDMIQKKQKFVHDKGASFDEVF